MDTSSHIWERCAAAPNEGETIRWIEPIWAEPNKPRGKRDIIGEQRITAKVLSEGEIYELTVIKVENRDPTDDAPLKTKEGDLIKRREASIAKGDCHKLTQE